MDNTFWQDFTIADHFGGDAVKDTFNRAFKEWKTNYKMLTELIIVLNHKIWQHYEADHDALAHLYNDCWAEADAYAMDNLKGDELTYFLEMTD
jgi:hypothetical protein